MFDAIKEQIIESLPVWGYPVIFLGVMLENAGIPVPGETIVLTAGFLSFKGILNPIFVVLSAFTGAVIGDNIGFFIGYKGGRPLLQRYGNAFFVSRSGLERTERLFQKHGGKIIFIARFVTGFRVFAAVVAGVGKMQWRRFFFFNVSGAILWAIVITLVGYYFGQGRETMSSYFRYVDETILIAVAVAVVIYLVSHWMKR